MVTAVWADRAGSAKHDLAAMLTAIITKFTTMNHGARAFVGPQGSSGVTGIMDTILIPHVTEMGQAWQQHTSRPSMNTVSAETLKMATTALGDSLTLDFMKSTECGQARTRQYLDLLSELHVVSRAPGSRGTLKLSYYELGVAAGRINLDPSESIIPSPRNRHRDATVTERPGKIPKKSASAKVGSLEWTPSSGRGVTRPFPFEGARDLIAATAKTTSRRRRNPRRHGRRRSASLPCSQSPDIWEIFASGSQMRRSASLPIRARSQASQSRAGWRSSTHY